MAYIFMGGLYMLYARPIYLGDVRFHVICLFDFSGMVEIEVDNVYN